MYGGSLGGRPSPAAAGRYGHGQRGMGAAARRGGGGTGAAAAAATAAGTAPASGGRRARSAGGGSGATARSGSSGSRTGSGGGGPPRGRSTSQGRGGVAPPSHALSPAPRPARPAVTNIATRQSTVGRAALLSPRAKVGGGVAAATSALNSSHVSSAVGSSGTGAPTATVTMVVPHGSRASAGAALPHPSALRHTLSGDVGRTASPPLAAARRFSHAVDPSPAPAAPAPPTESTNEVSSTPGGSAAGNDFASTNQAAVRVMQRVQRLMNVLEGKKAADPPAPTQQQQQQQQQQPPPSSGTSSDKPAAGADEGPSSSSSSPSKPAVTTSASPGSSYRVSRSTAEIMRRYAPAAAAGVPKLPPGGPGGAGSTTSAPASPSTPPSLSSQHQPLDPRYRPYYSTLQHAFSSSAAPTPPSQQQASGAAAPSAPLTPTHARHRGMSPPPPPPPSATPPPLTYGRGGIGGAGGGTSALTGSYGSRVRGMSPPPRNAQVAGKMTTTVQSRHSVEREFSKQGLLASPGSLVRSPTQQRPGSASREPGPRGGEARVVTIAPASDKESKDRARHEGVLSRLSERIVADAKTKMAAAAAAAPTTPPSSSTAPPPPAADGSDGGDKDADVTVSDLDLSTASLVGKSGGGGGGGGAAAAPETAAGEKQAEEEEEEAAERDAAGTADAFSPEARVMAAPPAAAAAAVAWPVEPSPMREDLLGDAASSGGGLQQRQQVAAGYSSYGLSSPPASTRESMQAPAVSPSVATDRSSSYHASNSPTPPPSLLPPPPPPPPPHSDDDAASVASADSHEQPNHHPRSPIIGGHPETQHPSPTLSPTLLPAAAPQFDANGSSRAVSRSPRSEEGEAAPMLRVDPDGKPRSGPEKRIFSPPPQHPTRFHAQTHTQEVFGEDTLLPPPPPVDGAAEDVHRRIDLSGGIDLLDGKSSDADAAAAAATAAAASDDDDDDVLDSGLLVEGDAWGLPGTSGPGRGMGRRESGVQCAKRRRAVEEVAWLREGVEAYVRSDRVRRSEDLYESFEKYGDGGAAAASSSSGKQPQQKTFRLKPEEVSDLVAAALTTVSCEDMRRLVGDTVAQAVELARARVARADRLPRCTFHRVPAKSLAAQMKQAVQKGKVGVNGRAAVGDGGGADAPSCEDGGGGGGGASAAATPLQTEVRRVCEEWVKEKLSDAIATDALAKKETTEAAAGWVLTSKAARGRVVDSWVDMMVTYLLHDTVDYFNSMETQQG